MLTRCCNVSWATSTSPNRWHGLMNPILTITGHSSSLVQGRFSVSPRSIHCIGLNHCLAIRPFQQGRFAQVFRVVRCSKGSLIFPIYGNVSHYRPIVLDDHEIGFEKCSITVSQVWLSFNGDVFLQFDCAVESWTVMWPGIVWESDKLPHFCCIQPCTSVGWEGSKR